MADNARTDFNRQEKAGRRAGCSSIEAKKQRGRGDQDCPRLRRSERERGIRRGEEGRGAGLRPSSTELEELLRTATFVDDTAVSTEAVAVGTVVTRAGRPSSTRRRSTRIVGFTEADPTKLFISQDSPIGEALVGARVGDARGREDARRNRADAGSFHSQEISFRQPAVESNGRLFSIDARGVCPAYGEEQSPKWQKKSRTDEQRGTGDFRAEPHPPGEAQSGSMAEGQEPLRDRALRPHAPLRRDSAQTYDALENQTVSIAGQHDVPPRHGQGHLRPSAGPERRASRSTSAATTWARTRTGTSKTTIMGDVIGVKGFVFKTKSGEDQRPRPGDHAADQERCIRCRRSSTA